MFRLGYRNLRHQRIAGDDAHSQCCNPRRIARRFASMICAAARRLVPSASASGHSMADTPHRWMGSVRNRAGLQRIQQGGCRSLGGLPAYAGTAVSSSAVVHGTISDFWFTQEYRRVQKMAAWRTCIVVRAGDPATPSPRGHHFRYLTTVSTGTCERRHRLHHRRFCASPGLREPTAPQCRGTRTPRRARLAGYNSRRRAAWW